MRTASSCLLLLLALSPPAAAEQAVKLEVSLREGPRMRRRTILYSPGKGLAVLRSRGLEREVVWLQTARHVWRWTAGEADAERGGLGYPLLPRRPWRTELDPWGRLLALRELHPGKYPIAHWLLADRLRDVALPAAWRRATRGAIELDATALRRELAGLALRHGPSGLAPPADLRLRWALDGKRVSGLDWRVVWAGARSAGRLELIETQRVAGLVLPRRARLHRRCLHPLQPHARGTVEIVVEAAPYLGRLPEPPPLLARGLVFERPDYLRAAVARDGDDAHLRRQLAAALPAGDRERREQIDWLARRGHGTEARILALRGARRPGARLSILRQRLAQDERSTRDLVLGLMLERARGRAWRDLLERALARHPGDVGLEAVRWAADTNALRTLRSPELREALAASRVRLLASPRTPSRLFRDVLHDVSAKGPREAQRHLELWRAAQREATPPLRRDLVDLALCGWARRPHEAREASARLARRLARFELPDVTSETLYLVFGLACPELQPADRERVIAHISQALPGLDARWRARWLGLVLIALRAPDQCAAWLAGFVRRDPSFADRLLAGPRLSWIEQPDRVLRALPQGRDELRLLRARLALRANRPREAFALLRGLLAGKAPGEPALATYSALLLHGPARPIDGERRPGWLPDEAWIEDQMAWTLFEQAVARHPAPRLLLDAARLARALGKPEQPLLLRALDGLQPGGDPTLAGAVCRSVLAADPAALSRGLSRLTAGGCLPLLPDEASLWLGLAARTGRADLVRLAYSLERELPARWRVEQTGRAVRALVRAGQPLDDLAGLPSPIARHLQIQALLATKQPRQAQRQLVALLADWPGSPRLWALLLQLQETNQDWPGVAATLQRAGAWLAPRQRRDLLVKVVRGLIAGKQLQQAILLAEQFCRQHPRDALFTSTDPLVALLEAGQLAVVDKLLPLWDRRPDGPDRTATRIELLIAGKRPFEAYGLLRKLGGGKLAQELEQRLLREHGADLPFQWYLRTARFPAPDEQERARQELLVRRLGSASYAARQRAAASLRQLGERAGRALLAGARSEDLEVRRQCLAVLRSLFERRR